MTRSTSTEMSYTARRIEVARLYLEGKRQAEIAEQFGVTQATISRDLSAVRKQWQEEALLHFDAIKARELARIDRLEVEYWDAWRRSQEDAETIKQKGKAGDNQSIKPVEIEKTAKGQAGDPRFLQGVQWCIEQRLKIYGVYEAIKYKEVGWKDDIVQALIDGSLKPEDVRVVYADSPDLIAEFFARANINASNEP